jgi:hypothetical protein
VAKLAHRGGSWEKGGVDSKNSACCKYDCTFDNILKLANVSRPGIVHQQIHGLLMDGVNIPAKFVRESFQEDIHRLWNVGTTIAKRWKLNGENI